MFRRLIVGLFFSRNASEGGAGVSLGVSTGHNKNVLFQPSLLRRLMNLRFDWTIRAEE
jgi:hypothetical protein